MVEQRLYKKPLQGLTMWGGESLHSQSNVGINDGTLSAYQLRAFSSSKQKSGLTLITT